MKLIDCPRDALQGLPHFVPTELKVKYINTLLRAGFDTVDFGSFVSPKAIPQMRDTAQVLDGLDLSTTSSKLLAIVANLRGADDAAAFDQIDCLGFPFSISETFQQRNTGSSIDESLGRVEDIQNVCKKADKQLVVYISMAFGNPYGDPYHSDIAAYWTERLHRELEVEVLAMSDTVGSSTPELIRPLFEQLIPAFKDVEFGAHLHSNPETWQEKIESAYEAGCRRFDGALRGYGGCPMAKDELTGNVASEKVVGYFTERGIATGVDASVLSEALMQTTAIFDPMDPMPF
ncbi:MAG: hydroxymethylglutaryl-CoA lyase [Flavobacteriales bacterium]